MRLILLLPAMSIVWVMGCSSTSSAPSSPASESRPSGPPWFEDVTEKLQISFRQKAGETSRYFMPQVMGSGMAVLDADNDGRFDLLFLNNAGPDSGATHQFFRQRADGTFVDATSVSGLGISGFGMGAAVGDIDNDGSVDLYISQYGGGRLFHNRGDGTFEDVTKTSGVDEPRWGTSCAFFDYNRDGWLDLIVVHYVDYDPSLPCVEGTGRVDYCHPSRFPGTAARLFHNRGKADGKWLGFQDVSGPSGIASKPSSGLGVLCNDFTQDGWPDIFIANDARPNHLWVNQKDGTFKEEALARGVALDAAGEVRANMGIAIGDLHNRGLGDLFVTHLSEELHTLWQQHKPGQFRDITAFAGLAATRWRGTGFGTIALDFDHDGNRDLTVANGRVMRARSPVPNVRPDLPEFWKAYAERNQLFQNKGAGQFQDISLDSPALTGTAEVGRGLAWADLDGDGAMDLILTSVEGPARILRNVAPKAGHWLIVRAYDLERKRDAIGAVVRISAKGQQQIGFAIPGQSYCSSGDPRVHFGLGSCGQIEKIQVDWPDGTHEIFPCGDVDRVVTVNRGQGQRVTSP